MSAEELEQRVAEFLDERAGAPELEPETFAQRFGAAARVIESAIARALTLERTLMAAQSDEPQRVGPYAIVRELGRGGMGIVYEASRDGRRVALKLLGLAAGANSSALQRFRREVQTLARLEHPGIVVLHDSGVERGSPYLVMELLQGPPLSEARLPLDPREAARLVAQVARAVSAAHGVGVLHRDLKPQNVILVAGRGPVLVDFGLAAALDDASLTESGAVLGTPRYMAPEQARGQPADPRSDVFALGLMLYELLCGQPARPERARSELLRSAARREVALPRAAGRALDRRLERVLLSAVAWNPGRRTRSAAELADDLERWLEGKPVAARAPSILARGVDSVRRRPAAWALGVVVTLAAVAAASWFRDATRPAEFEAELARRRRLALVEACCGATASAERALDSARTLDADDPVTVRVSAWLASAPAPNSVGAAPNDELARLEAVRALRTQAPELALAECVESRRAHARSAALAALEGELLEELERDPSTAWRGAIEFAPDAPSPRWRLAQHELVRGSVDDGLDHAIAACARFEALGVDSTNELPKLLSRARSPSRVRALVRERAEREGDARLWYALAWLHDNDHELERAVEAYERALAVDPSQLLARLNLAHLHAGAQLGACGDCERAYGACEGCLDPERAIAELLEVLARDRGENDYAAGRVVQTALDLARRAPHSQAPQRLVAQLDRLIESAPAGRSASLRLADARARLERATTGDREAAER